MKPAVHDYADKLLDLAYGELPGGEASQLEAHVLTCEQCSEALHSIRGVRKTMSQLPPPAEPDTGLESLLAYAEQSARRSAAGPAPSSAVWRKWLAPVLGFKDVAALAMVLLPVMKSADAPSPAESAAALKVEDAKFAKAEQQQKAREEPPPPEVHAEAKPVVAAQPMGKSAELREGVQGDSSKALANDELLAKNVGDEKEAAKREKTAAPLKMMNSADYRGVTAANSNSVRDQSGASLGALGSNGYGNGGGGLGSGKGGLGSVSSGKSMGSGGGFATGHGSANSGASANGRLGGEDSVAYDDEAGGGLLKQSKPMDKTVVVSPAPSTVGGGKLDANKDSDDGVADRKVADVPAKQKAQANGPVAMVTPPPPAKKAAAKREEKEYEEPVAAKEPPQTESYRRSDAPAAVAQDVGEVTSAETTRSRGQQEQERSQQLHSQFNALSAQAWDARKKGDRGLEITLLKQALALGITGGDLSGTLNRLCETEAAAGNTAEAQGYCDRLVREFPNTPASQLAQRQLRAIDLENAVPDAPGQHSPAAPAKDAPKEKKATSY
ncbi:MAG: anti-sigma factor family protein [Myxococcaceae bacterium]